MARLGCGWEREHRYSRLRESGAAEAPRWMLWRTAGAVEKPASSLIGGYPPCYLEIDGKTRDVCAMLKVLDMHGWSCLDLV